MRLLIAIGTAQKNGEPELVYLGREGTAMEAACKAAPYPFIEKFFNPRGVRKHNGGAAANAAAEESAFRAETEAAQAEYNEAVLAKAHELAGPLRARLAELEAAASAAAGHQQRADQAEAAFAKREAELTSLRAELKAAKKKGGREPEPTDPAAAPPPLDLPPQ